VNHSAEWETAAGERLAKLRARARGVESGSGTKKGKGPSAGALDAAEEEAEASRQGASVMVAFCP